jgi:hypothetical protein
MYFEIKLANISSMQHMVQCKQVMTDEVITAHNYLERSGTLNWVCELLQQK